MIRILIADDHTIVREGLKQIIEDRTDMCVAGEARNGWEALEKVKKNNYDLVLLDISMPGPGGLDVLKQLKDDHPKLRILILSMYPEEQYAVRALRAGASGYLTKESASDELIAAIRMVHMGRKYISASIAEKLVSELGGRHESEEKPHETLSDREFQVMGMIGSGKKAKEIAEELSLSVKTVSTYRSRILEKMKMKSNAELIRYAITHGLVV